MKIKTKNHAHIRPTAARWAIDVYADNGHWKYTQHFDTREAARKEMTRLRHVFSKKAIWV